MTGPRNGARLLLMKAAISPGRERLTPPGGGLYNRHRRGRLYQSEANVIPTLYQRCTKSDPDPAIGGETMPKRSSDVTQWRRIARTPPQLVQILREAVAAPLQSLQRGSYSGSFKSAFFPLFDVYALNHKPQGKQDFPPPRIQADCRIEVGEQQECK